MSSARWEDPSKEKPDPRRKRYFDEWVAEPKINENGVSLGRYIELRESGQWNAYAAEHLWGRFQVEDEG